MSGTRLSLHGNRFRTGWLRRTHIQSLEGSCYTTSRFVQDEFNRMGVSGVILEGCIEVGRNDYLEHRANLVWTVNFYAFIDLASRQFGRAIDGLLNGMLSLRSETPSAQDPRVSYPGPTCLDERTLTSAKLPTSIRTPNAQILLASSSRHDFP